MGNRRSLAPIALAAALAALATPGVAAAAPQLPLKLSAPASLTAPASALKVRAQTQSGAICSLSAHIDKSTMRAVSARAPHGGLVEWSWLVPAKAPTGRWRLSVSCAGGASHASAARSLNVHTASRNHFGPLLQRSTGLVVSGGPIKPLKGKSPDRAAHAARSNPFPWGECTWWASEKRPDLFPAVHGNAGDWLTQAQRGGIPTGSTPAVGAIAVFFPYAGGAGGYGHVAYVQSVNGDGSITISEYNWAGYHVGPTTRHISPRIVSGFIYGGPVGTPGYHPPPSGGGTSYNVYGTGSDGLFEHSGPDAGSAHTGLLPSGSPVTIVCQIQTSSAVRGSTIWDKLDNGSYVSDYFVDTPGVGGFTNSIPRCGTPPPPTTPPPPAGSATYHIYHSPGGAALRNGPSTSNALVTTAPNGQAVNIRCQTKSGSFVGSSDVWDLLTNSTWVADYYVDTPNVGTFSPGLDQCSTPPTAQTYVAPAGSSPQAHKVVGTGSDGLYEHPGPGTNYAHDGWLPNGAAISIACQIKSASAVNNSTVWDLLTDGNFVSDYYTDTPTVGDYSPGIARCVTSHKQ